MMVVNAPATWQSRSWFRLRMHAFELRGVPVGGRKITEPVDLAPGRIRRRAAFGLARVPYTEVALVGSRVGFGLKSPS